MFHPPSSFPFRLTVIGLSLACLAHPQAALANEPTLPAVEASAQRQPSDSTVRISAEKLERKAAQDTREIFQDEPGVVVGGGGLATAQKVYVRGIEDSQMGRTLDGASQSSSGVFHHQGRMLLNPELIKSIEVEKGAASASAGPGALAGNIRITTKDAGDLLEQGEKIGTQITGEASSNKGWKGATTAYAKPLDTLDLLVSATRQERQDYRDGQGNTLLNSGSKQEGQLAKLNWQPLAGQTVTLGYQALTDRGYRWLRNHMSIFPGNDVAHYQELEQTTLTARHRYDGRFGGPSTDITVYDDLTQNWRTNSAPALNKPTGYRYGEEIQGRGINATLQSRLGQLELKYGFNHQRQETRLLNPYNLPASNRGAEDSAVSGLFVEGLLPLAQFWQLGAGLRYDRYTYTDLFNKHFASSGLSPSGKLSFQATEALKLYGSAGRTQRGVRPMEVMLVNSGYVNQPGLKAETATHYELGFDYATRRYGLKGALFQMTIDDYILGTGLKRFNAGQARSWGYELGSQVQQGPLRATAGMAYSRPSLKGGDLGDSNMGLGVATGRSWMLGLSYAQSAQLEWSWNARFVEGHRYQQSGVTLHKAGYGVHDLHANWEPQGKKGPRITASVRNLFNKYYYDQASFGYSSSQKRVIGWAEPGREFRLQGSWKF